MVDVPKPVLFEQEQTITIDRSRVALVDSTWDKFVKELEVERVMSPGDYQARIEAKLQQKIQGKESLDYNEAVSIVRDVFGISDDDERIEEKLLEVEKALFGENVPRADVRPEARNEQILGKENLQTLSGKQRKEHPLLKKLDPAIDPKARDAAINDVAQALANNPKADMTPQLKLAAKLQAKMSMAKKLEATLKYDYTPKVKPVGLG